MEEQSSSLKWYYKRRESGLCTRCGKPIDNGLLYCSDCSEKRRESGKLDRELCKKIHICPTCRKNILYGDEKKCMECKNYRAEYYRNVEKNKSEKEKEEQRRKNAECEKKRKERRKAQGLCVRCGKRKAGNGFLMCGLCRAKSSERRRLKRAEKGIGTSRKYWVENGLCYNCGKLPKPGYKVCEECYQRIWQMSHSENAGKARKELKKQGILY